MLLQIRFLDQIHTRFSTKNSIVQYMKTYIFGLVFIITSTIAVAQQKVTPETHTVLGVPIDGNEIAIPFSEKFTREAWLDYTKDKGKPETTQGHLGYEGDLWKPSYSGKLLFFAQLKGDDNTTTLWTGLDPQGVPKAEYDRLQKEVTKYTYDFYIKIRKDAVQKEIDEAEQATAYLSKEFEKLKRDERRTERKYTSTNEKIVSYEQELVSLRSDSAQYLNHLNTLEVKIDSAYKELEKVKQVIELKKQKLESIE